MQYRKLFGWSAGLFAVAITSVVESDPVIILDHAQRPKNAPIVTEVKKNAAWYQSALHGITQPYPQSIKFLEAQGNWHTPFNHPGMPGRYDLRGWHQ